MLIVRKLCSIINNKRDRGGERKYGQKNREQRSALSVKSRMCNTDTQDDLQWDKDKKCAFIHFGFLNKIRRVQVNNQYIRMTVVNLLVSQQEPELNNNE